MSGLGLSCGDGLIGLYFAYYIFGCLFLFYIWEGCGCGLWVDDFHDVSMWIGRDGEVWLSEFLEFTLVYMWLGLLGGWVEREWSGAELCRCGCVWTGGTDGMPPFAKRINVDVDVYPYLCVSLFFLRVLRRELACLMYRKKIQRSIV